jgi:hypothetical protein
MVEVQEHLQQEVVDGEVRRVHLEQVPLVALLLPEA